MTEQTKDSAFIQTPTGDIPVSKVLKVGNIEFTGKETDGGRERKFTLSYGLDGIVLTEDFLDDDHRYRDRLEKVRDAVMDKVAAAR